MSVSTSSVAECVPFMSATSDIFEPILLVSRKVVSHLFRGYAQLLHTQDKMQTSALRYKHSRRVKQMFVRGRFVTWKKPPFGKTLVVKISQSIESVARMQ